MKTHSYILASIILTSSSFGWASLPETAKAKAVEASAKQKGPKAMGNECPAGFKDDGLFCRKPESYGRGAGYPWKLGDTLGALDGAKKRCEAEHSQGCEKYGAIVYPKCKDGFHAMGCCTCSPDCPKGMTDVGVSCKK